MSVPFSSSRLKLERAMSHLGELERNVTNYFSGDWHEVNFGRDPVSGDYSFQTIMKGRPKDFSVILGDIVHNLRAALDLMAVECVAINEGNTKGVMFPFCNEPAHLPKMIKGRKFHRASNEAVEEMLRLKPYRGGNVALRGLHDLDIADKHHRLIPAASIITTPEIGIVMEDDGVTPKGITTGDIEMELKNNLPPTVEFCFPEDFPFAGQAIVPTLHHLVGMVSDIIDRFETISGQ